MDHRISKDMISSGMIPSGEKKQEDLSRTQYGTAPSPNALADVYKSMYETKEEVINEHHKKDADGNTIPHEDEELNEGKMPAGLQAYLDKKKGKKEDKKEMKEGNQRDPESSKKDRTHSNQPDPSKDGFTGIGNMSINDIMKMNAKMKKDKKDVKEGIGMALKTGLKLVKKIVTSQTGKDLAKDAARGAAMQAGAGAVSGMMSPNVKKKETVSNVTAGADLFDIVKGQLLDEGLSEEEIRDIMLTLTPDEILSEYKDVPSGQMNYASYGVPKPKSYEMDSLKRQTAPGGGKDYKIEDKKNVIAYNQKKISKEEYKGSGTPEEQAAMKAQVEVSKKVNRYGGKTPSGTTAVDAKRGIEDVRKSM